MSSSEDFDSGGKGLEVILDRYIGFSGHDVGADGGGNGFEVHSKAVYASIFEFLEPAKVIGGFALGLDGEIYSLFDGLGAFGKVGCAAIVGIGGTAGHHHVFDAVELDGCGGDFSKLSGSFAGNSAIGGEGLFDRTKLANCIRVAVAHTGLLDGGGEYVVAVEEGDFPVGDAVGGGEVVEVGGGGEFDRDGVVVGKCEGGGGGGVGGVGGGFGVDGYHDSGAVEGDGFMVGGACAAFSAGYSGGFD